MAKRKQPILAAEAHRRNLEQLARLGEELRRSRLQRRLTQSGLAIRTGLAQTTISDIELGRGGGHTLDSWQRLVVPLGRTLTVSIVAIARRAPSTPVISGSRSWSFDPRVGRATRVASSCSRLGRPTPPTSG